MAIRTYTAVPKTDLPNSPGEIGSVIHEREITSDLEARRPKWRLTLQLAVLTTALVLLINLLVTVYFAVSRGVHAGTPIIYEGDCTRATKLSTWSHIGINILSTILLGASNNAQQYLVAPTRSEVERAHSLKDWLDIGIPSMRNLFSSRIAVRRRVLWWLLALGSVPLHWLYNSAMFSSLSAKEYSVLVVSHDFVDGTNPGFVDPLAHVWNTLDVRATNDSVATIRSVMNTFERLTPSECVTAYAQQVVPSRRDVVIVLNAPDYDVRYCVDDINCWYATPNVTNSLLQIYSSEYGNWRYDSRSYDWICSGTGVDCSNPYELQEVERNFTLVEQYPVDYCLSEQVQEQCTFRLSLPIMVIVIIFNALKIACLISALRAVHEAPLATIGDAVASFMQHHDSHTAGMALIPKSEFRQTNKWVPGPRQYNKHNPRYYSSASAWKWCICNLLYAAGICTIAGLINRAIVSMGSTISGPSLSSWTVIRIDGFGKIFPQNLLLLTSSFVPSVLLANLPQLILSAIYLTYNALATGMCATREYTSYSVMNLHKKRRATASSLRVSSVDQNSTQRRAYYLQLPFRYAIPLMIGSTGLHWLASQSFFLAKVDIFHSLNAHTPSETQVLDQEASLDTCAFSVLPMICALIVCGVMTISLNLFGLFKVQGGMPVAGSCSAAIAAACHGRGCGLGPVTWGVVDEGDQSEGQSPAKSGARPGRLGFVDGVAQTPIPSHFYS